MQKKSTWPEKKKKKKQSRSQPCSFLIRGCYPLLLARSLQRQVYSIIKVKRQIMKFISKAPHNFPKITEQNETLCQADMRMNLMFVKPSKPAVMSTGENFRA